MRNYIFDFATQYYWSHPDIRVPSDFVFTDKDYADFAEMLAARNFSYRTITQTSLNELIETAKKEKYYDLHRELFMKLEKDLSHSLSQDLAIFRPEITELLEEEIVGRYFYEGGAIAWGLRRDEQLSKAMEILNNPVKYSSVLSGKSGSLLISSKSIVSDPVKNINGKSEAEESV